MIVPQHGVYKRIPRLETASRLTPSHRSGAHDQRAQPDPNLLVCPRTLSLPDAAAVKRLRWQLDLSIVYIVIPRQVQQNYFLKHRRAILCDLGQQKISASAATSLKPKPSVIPYSSQAAKVRAQLRQLQHALRGTSFCQPDNGRGQRRCCGLNRASTSGRFR